MLASGEEFAQRR